MSVLSYVVLNPVRAGLCDDPAEWQWSSYRATAGLERCPSFLVAAPVRRLFGRGSEGAERYAEHVRELAKLVRAR